MDLYGPPPPPPPELFRVDDLFNFSNDDEDHDHHHLIPPTNNNNISTDNYFNAPPPPHLNYFSSTQDLTIPSDDDVAELEWLSKFVDESFTDYPANSYAGTVNHWWSEGRSKSKRSRSSNTSSNSATSSSSSSSSRSDGSDGARRCTHCASEKTPQWRTGPLGPKTLCNACGVRYKSGRLVPEYRPAASPTFVLTQHSNSHRKVMELRRQKELLLLRRQQTISRSADII